MSKIDLSKAKLGDKFITKGGRILTLAHQGRKYTLIGHGCFVRLNQNGKLYEDNEESKFDLIEQVFDNGDILDLGERGEVLVEMTKSEYEKAKELDVESAIMMTKEFWLNSQFSIARFYGGIHINGTRYIMMGSEQDLVDNGFAKYYNKLGREKFMQILEQNNRTSHEAVMRAMEDALNALKILKRARKKQDNQLQTHLEL